MQEISLITSSGRKARLPNPVFLEFPCGSAGKECTCNEGDFGWKNPWRRERLPSPVFWPGEFHGLYSPWGPKELDTTEWRSLSLPGNLMRLRQSLKTSGYSLLSHSHPSLEDNFSLVQFSCSVVSDYLRPHELQHARPPCPSPTPGLYSHSCPLSPWCHPTISSSVVPFSSCPQSLPASGSFQMSQLFASGGQSIGVQLQHQSFQWTPRTDLLAVQGTLKSLLQYHGSKASILRCSAFFIVQLSHPYMTTGKTIALTRWTFVGKVMSLLFSMLSRLVITFLPRSKHLLISWLQSPSAVILEPENKVCHCFHCFPIYLPWSDGTRCHDLSFLNVEL